MCFTASGNSLCIRRRCSARIRVDFLLAGPMRANRGPDDVQCFGKSSEVKEQEIGTQAEKRFLFDPRTIAEPMRCNPTRPSCSGVALC